MPPEKRRIIILKQDEVMRGVLNMIVNEIIHIPPDQVHNFDSTEEVDSYLKDTTPEPVLFITGTRIQDRPLLPWMERVVNSQRASGRDVNTVVLTGNVDEQVAAAYRRFATVVSEPMEVDSLVNTLNKNLT